MCGLAIRPDHLLFGRTQNGRGRIEWIRAVARALSKVAMPMVRSVDHVPLVGHGDEIGTPNRARSDYWT